MKQIPNRYVSKWEMTPSQQLTRRQSIKEIINRNGGKDDTYQNRQVEK